MRGFVQIDFADEMLNHAPRHEPGYGVDQLILKPDGDARGRVFLFCHFEHDFGAFFGAVGIYIGIDRGQRALQRLSVGRMRCFFGVYPAFDDVCARISRLNRADIHAERLELKTKHRRQRKNCRFHVAVNALERHRKVRGHRADVDNGSAFCFAHMRKNVVEHANNAEVACVKLEEGFLRRRFFDSARSSKARVVNQHVDTTVPLQHIVHRVFDGCFVLECHRHHDIPHAAVFNRFIGRPARCAVYNISVFRHRLRNGLADAGTGAGHKNDLMMIIHNSILYSIRLKFNGSDGAEHFQRCHDKQCRAPEKKQHKSGGEINGAFSIGQGKQAAAHADAPQIHKKQRRSGYCEAHHDKRDEDGDDGARLQDQHRYHAAVKVDNHMNEDAIDDFSGLDEYKAKRKPKAEGVKKLGQVAVDQSESEGAEKDGGFFAERQKARDQQPAEKKLLGNRRQYHNENNARQNAAAHDQLLKQVGHAGMGKKLHQHVCQYAAKVAGV